MPLFGAPRVDQLRAKGDVPGLIKALGYAKDAHVRTAAAVALGQIGDPRAFEPLIAILLGSDWEVREAAAVALGQIGDPRAFEPLIAILRRDKNFDMKLATANALAGLGARAVEPLIAALGDTDATLRWAAAVALGQIRDPRAVKPLIVALSDTALEVRTAAAGALGGIGDSSAVEPLIVALDDRIWLVQRAAVSALGCLGDARAVRPLVAILDDAAIKEEVREAAAKALENLGIPDPQSSAAGLPLPPEGHEVLAEEEKMGSSENALKIMVRLQVLIATSSEVAIPGYLQDKSTSDLVMAISKCDKRLEHLEGAPSTMVDAVTAGVRAALAWEVRLRGQGHLLPG